MVPDQPVDQHRKNGSRHPLPELGKRGFPTEPIAALVLAYKRAARRSRRRIPPTAARHASWKSGSYEHQSDHESVEAGAIAKGVEHPPPTECPHDSFRHPTGPGARDPNGDVSRLAEPGPE
jgi:hypothetical protein